MASSNEESKIGPKRVTDYYFVNDKGEPVSFTILPHEGEIPSGFNDQLVYVGGTVGLQQITYKENVVAWKYELSHARPKVMVMSSNKTWIELEIPRKSFERMVRPILITLFCLHFAKRNPEAYEASLWNQVVKSFSSIIPSENGLKDQGLSNIIRLRNETLRERGTGSILTAIKFGENSGIVFAADTLFTNDNGVTFYSPKIKVFFGKAIGGSGDSEVTDHIMEIYGRKAQRKTVMEGAEYVRKEFKKLCKSIRGDSVECEATTCEFLICGIDSGNPIIYHIFFLHDENGWGSFEKEEIQNLAKVGSGANYVGESRAENLFRDYFTMTDSWTLAVDIIIQAMKFDPQCGGSIDRVVMEVGSELTHDRNIVSQRVCEEMLLR